MYREPTVESEKGLFTVSRELEGDDPAGRPAAPGLSGNLRTSHSSWISHFHAQVSLTPFVSLQENIFNSAQSDLDQSYRVPLNAVKDEEEASVATFEKVFRPLKMTGLNNSYSFCALHRTMQTLFFGEHVLFLNCNGNIT